jgi:hypothetical protein
LIEGAILPGFVYIRSRQNVTPMQIPTLFKQILATALICWCANILLAQTTYLHCGRILPISGEPQTAVTLVVEGNKITRIEKGYSVAPQGAEVIDLKDKTVMPGLIDCHVHFEFEQNRSSYVERFTFNEADIAFQSAVFAKRTLEAGFTTVRDLGGRGVMPPPAPVTICSIRLPAPKTALPTGPMPAAPPCAPR